MVVIYAEKYSLAREIANALGAGARIPCPKDSRIAHWEFTLNGEAAVLCHGLGHLCELAPAKTYGEQYEKWDIEKYPCIPDSFTVQIKPDEMCQICFDYVKDFFDKADGIINATDPDREGELIFGYIYEVSKCNVPWKRLWLTDLTEEKIREAFNNLRTSDESTPLQEAGRARGAADWLIGINLTIAASLKYGSYNNYFTVGRVQTPTLSLVVEREKSIVNFVSKPFWKLKGTFSSPNGEFTGEYSEKIDTITAAEAMLNNCNNKQGKVIKVEVKTKSENAPLLFNTTQLQIAASKKLDWSIEKATQVMQSLYEKKLMSYPRTSTEHLTVAMQTEVAETLRKIMLLPEYADYAIPENEWAEFSKRHFDDDKVGSHTALIPTLHVPKELSTLNDDEKALYDLLVKSLLRIVYQKAEIEDTKLEIDVDGALFKASGSVIKNMGWYVVDSLPKKKNRLPEGISEGLVFEANYTLEEDKTSPPERFTEATLLSAMELAGKNIENEEARTLMKLQHMGLGTDATREPVIKDLFRKDFIVQKGKSLIPTEKGIFLIENLPIQDIKSAEMTGYFEKRLNDISLNRENASNFISEIKEKTKEWYALLTSGPENHFTDKNQNNLFCPWCGQPVVKFKIGYGCSGYKNGCKFLVRNEICSKKITTAQVEMLIKSGKTRVIKGFEGKKGTFDAALKLNSAEKKIEFEFVDSKKEKK